MRVLLSSANRDDDLSTHMEEFRTEIRNLNDKIEQLASEISTTKADGNGN